MRIKSFLNFLRKSFYKATFENITIENEVILLTVKNNKNLSSAKKDRFYNLLVYTFNAYTGGVISLSTRTRYIRFEVERIKAVYLELFSDRVC